MLVNEAMTSPVTACDPDDTLDRVARIMWELDCGSVPVTDDAARVIGIVTDRDVCITAWTCGRPLQQVPVRVAMATDVAVCHPHDPVEDAETLMKRRQVRRIPVVDDEGVLVGILSLGDLALAAYDGTRERNGMRRERVLHTLSSICQHRPSPLRAVNG